MRQDESSLKPDHIVSNRDRVLATMISRWTVSLTVGPGRRTFTELHFIGSVLLLESTIDNGVSMKSSRFGLLHQVIAGTALLIPGSSLTWAQFGPAATPPAAKGAEAKPVLVERAPLILRDSTRFQIPLRLEAARSVRISARVDGVVATLPTKLGDRVQAQGEVGRLESQERQLELAKAQAALRAAQAERAAASGPAASVAEARIDEAKAAAEIAALRLDACNLRSPLTGTVTQVHVSEGQFVKAGEPIVTVVDPTKLVVEVPIDAKTATAGSRTELMVEDQTVPATVDAIVPLRERFEPLRDLFVAVSTGMLSIDNSGGKLRVGQTAYSPMIPRQAVTEVPTSAVSNSGDGDRKVQVIRDGIVRDVRIQPLGQQGDAYLFVSGRFGAGDELVLKSSEPLLDGARIVAPEGTPTAPGTAGGSPPKVDPPRRGSSF